MQDLRRTQDSTGQLLRLVRLTNSTALDPLIGADGQLDRRWLCVSEQNPADTASRGGDVKQLLRDGWWLRGQDWLAAAPSQWPPISALNTILTSTNLHESFWPL